MENKTIYVGSGKTQSGKYGDFFKVSICLSDLPKEHITEAKNGKKYINLTINKKQQPDQYGKDLSVQIDMWKPEPKKEIFSESNYHHIPDDTLNDILF
jgi:hypothetical protein